MWRALELVKEQAWLNDMLSGFDWKLTPSEKKTEQGSGPEIKNFNLEHAIYRLKSCMITIGKQAGSMGCGLLRGKPTRWFEKGLNGMLQLS